MSRKFSQLFHDSHSWKRNATFENVSITPELAGELLRLNGKNRPVNNSTVKRYSEEMKAGRWQNNGDNIRISITGLILDGQHRLYSVLDSGVTITQNIVTGLDDKVFDTIDTGRLRSASDAVAVAGYKNYTTMAGATKLILAYKNGSLRTQVQGGTGQRLRITNHDVIEFINRKANVELLQECATVGNKCANKAKFFSQSTYAAFAYLFGEIDREESMLFFDMLTTGESIGKSSYSMIYLLRQKLINFQQSNANLQTTDKYALLIKAWNMFRKGKEVSHLSWTSSKEEFPTINK